MRFVNLLKKIIFFYAFLFCSFTQAAPVLNGIAGHQELGKDQFLGALFTETPSNNADILLAANQPMRIELKILSQDGISARRFSRMWIDGMAINNNPDILRAQANNIVKLDSLFKGRLISGDHIIFALTPGQGVNVSVNGITLGNINDDKFFSLILSSWIGKIPLSSEFKDGILKLGASGGALIARFDQIKPDSSRVSEVSGWAGNTQVAVASSSSKASKSSIAADLSVVGTGPTPIALPPLTQTEASSSSSSQAKSKAVAAASSVKKAVVEDDEDDSAPAFTAESLLARQFYVKEAIKMINKTVRYPASAQQKGQEGSVRVTVTLDRQGNIINIVASEPGKYQVLTKEAMAAIKRAAPFQPLPDAIQSDSIAFTAPIRFTLIRSQ
jgi:periplasmic protein TonB